MLAHENEMERVRGECRRLVEQNEDLQAQLLHDSVEKGRSLLADRPPSLADELNGTRDSKQVGEHVMATRYSPSRQRASSSSWSLALPRG